MENAKELKEKLEQIKKQKIEDCQFKKDEIVKYKGKNCRVGYVSYNEDKDEISVKLDLNTTRQIGWSSSYEFVKDLSLIEKINFDQETFENKIYQISASISENERKIYELSKEYRENIERLNTELKTLRSECPHKWDRGYSTGEVVKHLIGETEVEEMECEICGAVGKNC
jgi:hypothetical protein